MPFADHVLPHGPLRPLAAGLWEVTGTLSRQPLPRNMVIYRLPSGGLWLHSVIALDEPTMAELDALGPVEWIVVPSAMHRLDAGVYAERYPAAKVVCAEEITTKVEQEVRVDGALDALASTGIVVHHPKGISVGERVYELPLLDGCALIACDALFHLPHLSGFGGFVLRVLGSTGFFGTTRIGRFMMSDVPAWKGWLQAQAQRDDVRVVCVAHGDAVTTDVAEHLGAAAARL